MIGNGSRWFRLGQTDEGWGAFGGFCARLSVRGFLRPRPVDGNRKIGHEALEVCADRLHARR
jgi:hypothetical protein